MAKSVFYDIADDAGEAANLTARSLLMIAIEERIRERAWTQAKAAQVLGVSQPRVSDLLNGKIDKFSLDALVNLLPAVGLTFRVDRSEDRAEPVQIPPAPRPMRQSTVKDPRRMAVAARSRQVAVAKKRNTTTSIKPGKKGSRTQIK
ncbi:helix-turn-helix domain-containing protein [Mycolicibacterium obuense]|uniref:HTH cro/C1-type domain-containing protein n=1 Tax=Mycolicibacterium obuense TaxID=1807 RepID=A0A0J6VU75_9MYCO|nr:hypothetical protein MOBUDSM44075_03875 [Mycolicibacterium obuense]